MKDYYSTKDVEQIENELDRFWFEKKGGIDFPLYNGKPFELSWAKWIWWIIFTIGAFFVFTGLFLYPFEIFDGNLFNQLRPVFHAHTWIQYIFIIVGYLMIFGSYWIICKNHWNILFHTLRWKTAFFSIVFGLAGMVVMLFYSEFILVQLFHYTLNNDNAFNQDGKGGMTILQAIITLIQLIAEEFWSIVPFLFILTICYKAINLSRKTSIIIAWIASSIIFGAYHIPSYDGDLVQAFLVIGVDRILLTFVYLRYKSIWASYLTHVAWNIIPITLAVVNAGLINK